MHKARVKLTPDLLSQKEILRYMGWRGQELSDSLKALLEQTIAECTARFSPAYVWEVFPTEVLPQEQTVLLSGTTVRLTGRSITRHLSGSHSLALLAATLGMQAESYLRRLGHSDMTKALIAEAVCTDCIEKVCDMAQEEIKALAQSQGWHTNFRYSPGYGDLPLTVQPAVLRTLDTMKSIGLSCSESLLLIPRKSVTAVIGMFYEKPGRAPAVSCSACNLAGSCDFRKEGTHCESE